MECARSILKGKHISNGFWVEAINTAVYLKNRSPTRSLDFKTPFEALFGYKHAVKHLRVLAVKPLLISQRKIERNWTQRPSNVFLLGIVQNLRLTNCLIPLLIRFLQAEM